MRTLTAIVYECALDGKRFITEKECKEYEKKKLKERLKEFSDFCEGRECGNCILSTTNGLHCCLKEKNPCDWEDLLI